MKKATALLMLAVFLAGGIFSAAAFAAPGKRPQGEALAAIPKGELTENDVQGLLLMREEEKLAMDLYRELGAKWGIRTFTRIAESEQQHTGSVKLLIDRYGLPDPSEGKKAGKFSSPELQKLYDELLEQGSRSRIDALKAGALVEELDIMDLRKAIEETKNEDLRMVFSNLERGSMNHLGAFGRQLSRENVRYEARHMSQEEADSIMNSGSVQGSGRNRESAPGGRWRN
ncbi:MAG: DUF2202 domain-containing protein [Synergistaceae bacterium]|jgi:hypothetical protein|uniref:DUF2202 domain-containing protein n=1 Tax=Aminivibrio sp. TaxID=1872489 RepID=UPI0016B1A215|nr:DUF2202 domain-containing protein [Synergistaceae bacterium]NCC58373.1 DUF2202 domain-containing protein [Synergistales bacterium]NLO57157.1 DUF2202 domain-containing protein [Synergistaceae bacterium]